ncbi:MAG: hypothetical protein RTU92_08020 [Candidatus Thorarchaeota archaeon]
MSDVQNVDIINETPIDATALSSAPLTYEFDQKVYSILGGFDQRFGSALDMEDGVMVVGAQYDSVVGTQSGAVYPYFIDNSGDLFLEGILLGHDTGTADRFGTSVATDGITAVVGCPWKEPGMVYVFERRDSGSWTEVAKLIADDVIASDYYGGSVAVDGDVLVVGSPNNDPLGGKSGSAYVFTRDEMGLWRLHSKLLVSDGIADDTFGSSVAIHKNTIVIGAPTMSGTGAAYIFEEDEQGTWNEQMRISVEGRFVAVPAFIGHSVAIENDLVAVGATGFNVVYVSQRDESGVWSEPIELSTYGSEYFGYSVDVQGDYVIIGAPGTSTYEGAVYIFGLDENGNWVQELDIRAPDPAWGDHFGECVAVDGRTLVVGAIYEDDIAEDSGSIYIWKVNFPSFDSTPPTTIAEVDGSHGTNDWYISDVTVTLEATDDLSSIEDTYYSSNGITWEVYTDPLEISDAGTIEIQYYSTDSVGNVETTNAVSINIDKAPPVTTVELSGTGGNNNWWISDVTVNLTAVDDVSGIAATFYSLDEIDWLLYENPFEIGSEGENIVHYYSIDTAGSQEEIKNVTFAIDTSLPYSNLVIDDYYEDGTSIYVLPTSIFQLSFSDDISGIEHTYYRINDGEWVIDGENEFTLQGDDEFSLIEYYCTDVAGNVEPIHSVIVNLVSLETDSFVSRWPSPPCEANPLDELEIVFVKVGRHGYKLIGMKPSKLWFNVRIENNLPLMLESLTINPEIPDHFRIDVYLVWIGDPDGCVEPVFLFIERGRRCPIKINFGYSEPILILSDGTTVSVSGLPQGYSVYVTYRLRFSLRCSYYDSPDEFTIENYTFSALIEGVGGISTTTGHEFVESVMTFTTVSVTKDIRGRCGCFHMKWRWKWGKYF